ncbi:hypothetical protein BH23CHL4_BH23CHL4_12150 [soil metagenome]
MKLVDDLLLGETFVSERLREFMCIFRLHHICQSLARRATAPLAPPAVSLPGWSRAKHTLDDGPESTRLHGCSPVVIGLSGSLVHSTYEPVKSETLS